MSISPIFAVFVVAVVALLVIGCLTLALLWMVAEAENREFRKALRMRALRKPLP